jgi:hypothetical protein
MAGNAGRRVADNLRAARVAELTAGQLADVARIYEQAFPPRLRVPFDGLVLHDPHDLLLTAVEGSVPVAFAASMLLDECGWVFLRYYGVAATRRRQGLGQRFWQLLRPALQQAGWPDRIVFEVEHPDHAQDEDERGIRLARIEFWRSCGAVLLQVDGYVMPDIAGLAEPESMLLMAAGPDPDSGLRAGELVQVIREIYAARYRLESGDPLVAAAVASVRP